MSNEKLKAWANQAIVNEVSSNLTPRAVTGLIKGSAITETMLGFHREYRNEVFAMKPDFDAIVARQENLNRGQRKKAIELLQAEWNGMLSVIKKFDSIMTDQLNLIYNLSEQKQEAMHQVDESMYEQEVLMNHIKELVFDKGKRGVNINHEAKKLGIELPVIK